MESKIPDQRSMENQIIETQLQQLGLTGPTTSYPNSI
jgi:hypothetical protein